ncbi:family 10 glycosylhydrolase [Luteipulveratus sp. YIM 133132]|uniref:glycoside hydrolase family 10 protein n=1 Tax=Luteipulveratus flavus TaxID=3031728 RepID=UPI0023B16645|nr:family 10 glycosylhydrolase [Luteipulveratus sp. YIM 133132]MDE9366098.1 family 10 glycosylhydrolase [Luteipulveratus sp. YIM 133132]
MPKSLRSVLIALACVLLAATGVTSARADASPGTVPARPVVVPQPQPGACPTQATTPKRDLRAMWVASVTNIDWPSKPGLSVQQQKDELLAWFDLAVKQRHNAVILQVRPTADAFWPSAYEPWSKYLTGVAGQDPGWDPLGFAVTQAHQRNLELHAWFNPYRVSMDTNVNALAPNHPGRQHPDWIKAYGGKLYYNPGNPDARRYSVEAILDAVRRYDIDAVHFDDYFYPYPVAGQTFDDSAEYAKYGNGMSLADWRRNNVTTFMREVRDGIRRIRPHTELGVSPFAIWRNKATDPEGSDTTAGAQTYDDLYADTRKWVREELLDYITPQVYWSRGFAAADYEKVTDWWARQVTGTRVRLYIGQATYKVAANADPKWSNPGELSSHLEFNTRYPQVQGNIYFSAVQVRADRLGATTLLNDTWYTRPALTPAAPWLDDVPGAPREPVVVHATGGRVTWVATPSATSYAIYRVPSGTPRPCDLADARSLVATVADGPSAHQTWTDPQPGEGTYLVSAVDRAALESGATAAR